MLPAYSLYHCCRYCLLFSVAVSTVITAAILYTVLDQFVRLFHVTRQHNANKETIANPSCAESGFMFRPSAFNGAPAGIALFLLTWTYFNTVANGALLAAATTAAAEGADKVAKAALASAVAEDAVTEAPIEPVAPMDDEF